MSSAEDATIYGSWEKDRVLGVGGFGIVSLWKNVDDNTYLALKKCRWDNLGSGAEMITKKQKERWSKEVEIMKRLSHRNVVRSITLPDEFKMMKSELPILSMEFCSLGDLRQVLNKPENCCGLQEVEVRHIITDIANAVHYLHREKITHRDLKPENIVLQPDSETTGGVIYKLIDLGYAKELDQNSICNSFVGTLQYLAPELYLNTVYTSSVDYWSLGLVSHEVITGVRPFLPNMSPAEWMMHVKKKKSDEICAYQKVDDNRVVFKSELFKENHISDYLRVQLEKWLMVALEWNPEKRGKQNNQLVIFSMINKIFSKKIVLVFCVKLYKRLSYEVDSATAVSTLKKWIERDANQPVSQQLLLLPTGEQLQDDQFAVSCWDPDIQDVMLYVLPNSGLSLPKNISPNVPELVQFLLKNSKEPIDYPMKRRIWANAVYFVFQEMFLYQCFIDVYAVKMLWLVSLDQKLGRVYQDICTGIENVKTTRNFAEQSLNCDQRFFTPLMTVFNRSFPQHRQIFVQYEKMLIIHSEKLKEELNKQYKLEDFIKQVRDQLIGIKTKMKTLQLYLEPSKTKLPEMNSALKNSHRVYSNLLNSKKREHLQLANNDGSNNQTLKTSFPDMFKITYNFLKVRDRALNDEEFNLHLSDLSKCELEMTRLENQLNNLLAQVKACIERITDTQLKRQEELWKLITSLSRIQLQTQAQHLQLPGNDTRQISDIQHSVVNRDIPVVNNINITGNNLPYNSNEDISNQETPRVNFALNYPSNISTVNNHEQSKLPTISVTNGPSFSSNLQGSTANNTISPVESSLIFDENERLRCDLMESMTDAREMIQSILCETESMDWNSLYSG